MPSFSQMVGKNEAGKLLKMQAITKTRRNCEAGGKSTSGIYISGMIFYALMLTYIKLSHTATLMAGERRSKESRMQRQEF
jgi:hypothetical protein